MGLYNDVQDVFAPQRKQPNATPEPDEQIINARTSAFLVGVAAFLLPISMWFSTFFGTCFFDTISHFYYAPFAGGIFVGLLFFIGTFLVAYKGESTAEGVFAGAAGLCAFGTALVPTSGPGCQEGPFPARVFTLVENNGGVLTAIPHQGEPESYFALAEYTGALHIGFAAVLFVFLAFYCFVIFPRVKADQVIAGTTTLTAVKKRRNRLYFASGAVICLCILLLLVRTIYGSGWIWWQDMNVTFWLESLALFAFGLSWMVKGRFFGYALADDSEKG